MMLRDVTAENWQNHFFEKEIIVSPILGKRVKNIYFQNFSDKAERFKIAFKLFLQCL